MHENMVILIITFPLFSYLVSPTPLCSSSDVQTQILIAVDLVLAFQDENRLRFKSPM